MKRMLPFIIVVLSLMFVAEGSASAAPSSGRPCTRVGAVAKTGLTSLKCQVVKGKKVWVTVTSNSATATQTPVQPWQAVVQDIQQRGLASSGGSVPIALANDPKMNAQTVTQQGSMLRDMYGLLSSLAGLSIPTTALFMNEASRDWYMTQATSPAIKACGDFWSQVNPSDSRAFFMQACGDAKGGVILAEVGSNNTTTTALQPAHELTHILQQQRIGNQGFMPCWFTEGQANLYGEALGSLRGQGSPYGEYQRDRDNYVDTIRRIASTEGGNSASSWATFLRSSESPSSPKCLQYRLGYSVGLLVMERLYAGFGQNKILSWMDDTGRSGSWRDSFAKIFGITADQWYDSSATQYLANAKKSWE